MQLGDRFTIADAYLGVFASYVPHFGPALADLPALSAFSARFEALPVVLAARAAEGPLPFTPGAAVQQPTVSHEVTA
jgi:glutathione S-transferase